MADLPGSWHLLATCVTAIIFWELAKRLLLFLVNKTSAVIPVEVQDVSDDEDNDFLELNIPSEPHVEIALDPPCGLHFTNPKRTYKFENEHCYGSYMFFHPPVGRGSVEGPNGMNYAEYFEGKSRLWEARVQLNFKETPSPDTEFYFGVELDDYVPLSMASRQAQNMCTAAMRQAMGGMYQSPGDSPSITGERELPICVLPLWAFDQFIETPEGEEPPNLADRNFPKLGSRRYQRVAEYAKEMESLRKNLRRGTTYTFAFWGCSRFLDVINWMVIGIPVAAPIDFNKFAGKPPVRLVLYSLKSGDDQSTKDRRHLQSRKQYFFRAALWSWRKRPDRRRVAQLSGLTIKSTSSPLAIIHQNKKNLRRRITSFLKHSVMETVVAPCTVRK